MAERKGAGSLDKRITFLAPVKTDDGHGGTVREYERRFTVWARLRPRLGGETVVASRLQSKQPYTITVRSSLDTRQISASWRAVNDATGACFAIKSVMNPDERGAYLDFEAIDGDDD